MPSPYLLLDAARDLFRSLDEEAIGRFLLHTQRQSPLATLREKLVPENPPPSIGDVVAYLFYDLMLAYAGESPELMRMEEERKQRYTLLTEPAAAPI